jgi:hypothetical protein
MAYLELPVTADLAYQSFSMQLDGAVYTIRLRYNSRAGHWAMDLAGADGGLLVAGIALRLGVDLLSQHQGATVPPGRLFIMNFVDPYQEPDRQSLGRDVALIYQEAGA